MTAARSEIVRLVALLVVVGAALLYGDGVITPAISVPQRDRRARASRARARAGGRPDHVRHPARPFAVQKRGTGGVGTLFGPVMLRLVPHASAALGACHVAQQPAGPRRALAALRRPLLRRARLARRSSSSASVVLAVTGGEALYADMGHFGARPIRLAWLALRRCPRSCSATSARARSPRAIRAAVDNPFFALVPAGAAHARARRALERWRPSSRRRRSSPAPSRSRARRCSSASSRASRSATPRAHAEGQIYVPESTGSSLSAASRSCSASGASDELAAAYGIAVTGTMAHHVARLLRRAAPRPGSGRRERRCCSLALFLVVDLPFFAANAIKFFGGGWVPLAIGVGFITCRCSSGARAARSSSREYLGRPVRFRRGGARGRLLDAGRRADCRGTGIFMSSTSAQRPRSPGPPLSSGSGRCTRRSVILTRPQPRRAVVPESERLDVQSLGTASTG